MHLAKLKQKNKKINKETLFVDNFCISIQYILFVLFLMFTNFDVLKQENIRTSNIYYYYYFATNYELHWNGFNGSVLFL